jgi:hypothetical protein
LSWLIVDPDLNLARASEPFRADQGMRVRKI